MPAPSTRLSCLLQDINTTVVADLAQIQGQMDDVISLVDAATGTQRAPPHPFTPAATVAAGTAAGRAPAEQPPRPAEAAAMPDGARAPASL